MASTEIYVIRKDRSADLYDSVPKAMGGALLMWQNLEKKYLPSYTDSDNAKFFDWLKERWGYVHRFAYGEKAMREIWELWDNPNVSEDDKIILATTFDQTYIERDLLPRVSDLYRHADISTEQMARQADVLDRIYDGEDDCLGVFIHATNVISVCELLRKYKKRLWLKKNMVSIGDALKQLSDNDINNTD